MYRQYCPLQTKYTVPAHKPNTAELLDVKLNTFSEEQLVKPATITTRKTVD